MGSIIWQRNIIDRQWHKSYNYKDKYVNII